MRDFLQDRNARKGGPVFSQVRFRERRGGGSRNGKIDSETLNSRGSPCRQHRDSASQKDAEGIGR